MMIHMEHLTDAELARWSALDERYLVEIGRRAVAGETEVDSLKRKIENLQSQIDDMEFNHARDCEDARNEVSEAIHSLMKWARGALGAYRDDELPAGLRDVLRSMDAATAYLR